MTTRYRTAFMGFSGFTTSASGATKASKRIGPASDRKAAPIVRPQSRSPLDAPVERPGKSEAA